VALLLHDKLTDVIIMCKAFLSFVFFAFQLPMPSRRQVSRLQSGTRRVRSVTAKASNVKLSNQAPVDPVIGRLELDSHADTCVFGRNFVPLHFTGKECDVMPYSDEYEAVGGVQIVSAATAYDCQDTGTTYILVFNEGLWMPDSMPHSLINPNQLRSYGCIVQDNPFNGAPLYIEDPTEEIIVPFYMDGTISCCETRTPTENEIANCMHITMTSDREWNPKHLNFPAPHMSVAEHRQTREVASLRGDPSVIPSIDPSDDPTELFDIINFNSRLASSVRVTPRMVAAVMPSDQPTPNTFASGSRKTDISAASLAERWCIGLETAKKTLKNTTQRMLRSALLPLSRRYKADRIFRLPRLGGEWFTDTVFVPVKSSDGNICGQLFANERYFATFYPMDSKAKAGNALRTFCREFGIPESLRSDQAPEMCGRKTEFQKQIRQHDIKHHVAEANMHNQSPAEGVAREIKRRYYRIMFRKRVPRIFWDYGYRWTAEIMSLTHCQAHRFDGGGIPLQSIAGETVDISEYLDFGFYDFVWYRDNAGLGEPLLGRWLGVSKHVGSTMCYWVLAPNGQVVARSSVWRVTNLEQSTDEVKARCMEHDQMVSNLPRANDFPVQGDKPDPEQWADLMAMDDDFREEFFQTYADKNIKEADDYSPEVLDSMFINMELALPRGDDGPTLARVRKRLKDNDGKPIGIAHKNPILDTRLFEVEFLDGTVAAMAANAICENMYAQVDAEGHRFILLDEIIGHRTTGSEVQADDAFITTKTGQKRRKPTTKGWEILVRWKDGAETWTPLKDIKETYPVQLAEYATTTRIHEEPAFAWWIADVLRKRERILSKVKTKYWSKTHKYGIRIPKSVKEALAIDRENGETLWADAVAQEMKNVMIAFEEYEGEGLPPGYKKIDCHMIFDVKMGENYRRKARLVAGGHQTDAPTSITYSSVVARDSVRIAFLVAALNNLDIFACDIQNAYLTAPCREKVCTVAGLEFGSKEGRVMIIRRALYGLKSSGASFRAFLAEYFHEIGYRPTLADPDVWLRPAVKPNGEEYYEMILAYVDDVLVMSHDPGKTMEQIKLKFQLKGDKYGTPKDYLGATLGKLTTANGTECWTQSSDKYVEASIKELETNLKRRGVCLPNKCLSPLSPGYRPDTDVTAELKADGVQFYQELIGVLRWACELGRLDILLETSLMSAYLAMPREGQLEQVLHMFGYLKQHPKRKIAFDPDHPVVDEKRFKEFDWHDFYRGAKESKPTNAPPPRGRFVSTHCFVDANLAGDLSNRRSQTGILIFVNRAPVIWYSKRQSTVETSTFGSEIVAMKTAIEIIKGLRYKLRMFGIPIEEATNIFCDNEAVTKNCSIPESTLKKKHHSICYHHNREAVAAGTVRVAKEDTKTNLSDVFTKILGRIERMTKIDKFMY